MKVNGSCREGGRPKNVTVPDEPRGGCVRGGLLSSVLLTVSGSKEVKEFTGG